MARHNFDAVVVGVVEGDVSRLYSVHVEGMQREPGESLASFVNRHAPEAHSPLKALVSETRTSQMMTSHKPYVTEDLRIQQRLPFDEMALDYKKQWKWRRCASDALPEIDGGIHPRYETNR